MPRTLLFANSCSRCLAGVPCFEIVKSIFCALCALGIGMLGCNASETGSSAPPVSVAISEIMYHPVGETTAEEEHEYVELHNFGSTPVSLAAWKLRVDSRDRLTFPGETSLAAGQYLVLAKKKASLLSVPKYALAEKSVIGDYSGELDNGGASVAIVDASGRVIDSVSYDDEAPWPMGADAFGVQEEWLPALSPMASHAFMGRSLERVSATQKGDAPENWEASSVDGATPGRSNGVSQLPRPIVISVSATPEGGQAALIRAENSVRVSVTLSDSNTDALDLEYRLDAVEKTGTATSVVRMQRAPGTPATHVALLPKAAENTVVRYRILTNLGGAAERIGPRLTDPTDWYAYFVNPEPRSGRSYHLFISPERWTNLWRNISKPLSEGCTTNDSWDKTLPAVFVAEGKVYDVHVRYQGSRFQRTNGIPLPKWTAPGPSEPSSPLILSWRIKFPRYAEFDNQRTINLNKQRQSCPGVLNALESALFQSVGIPAQKVRFARFYINGGYYNYAMEVHGVDEHSVESYEGKGNPVGDLFKADGNVADGPWGRSNWSPLGASCNLPPQRRYELTYERMTHEYKGASGHAELIRLIEELETIKSSRDGDAAVRAYFEKNFDVSELITKFAIRNYAGVWDDGFHNFYPYRRPSDGKWQVFPQDFDCDFGAAGNGCGNGKPQNAATLSFYHPETAGGFTAGGAPELRLKIQLIKAFRADFAAKVRELDRTLFSETTINAELAKIFLGFDRAAWNEAPARFCDLDQRVAEAQTWLKSRRAFAAEGIK